MISTTKLARTVVKGDKTGRKSVVVDVFHRPDGRTMIKSHHKGQRGYHVQTVLSDEYVRVYINAPTKADAIVSHQMADAHHVAPWEA